MADNFGLKIGLEGEKEFKSALADINSQFKVLKSEMNLVSSAFDKNDTSVEALTARNTVLNKEIEAQRQKVEVLRAALENAASSFGENDRRTQAWQIQLNNAEATLNGMERELATNEKALDDLGDEMDDTKGDTKEFSDEVKKSGDTATESGSKFEALGGVLKTVGATLAATVAAVGTAVVACGKQLYDMANDAAATGDNIDKMSQKLGLSREAYQEWDYVLSQNGMEIDSMKSGIKTLTNTIDDAKNGTDKAIEKFKTLGITQQDLATKSREDIFAMTIQGLQSMTDETERAALASDLLGKSGTELAPLFNQTAESTQALIDKAHDLGMIMGDEAVDAAVNYTDAMDTMKRTFAAVKNGIVSDMLPGFTMVMTGLTGLIAGQEGAAEQVKEGAKQIVDSLTNTLPGIVDVLMNIVLAVAEIAPSIINALIQGITENLPELVTAAVGIIGQLVAGIVEALPQIAEAAVTLLTTLVDAIIEALPMLIEAAAQVIVTLATGIADALPTLIPTIVQVIVTVVQTLIDNLPQILQAALQLITGLAQGILDAIPVLVKALPEIINSIITFLLDSIPQIIETGIQLLTSLVEALPEIITAIVQAIPQIIDNIINAVINSIPLIIEAGIKLLVSLIQALPQIIVTIVQAIPQIVSGLVNAIIGNIDKIIMAGVQLFVALIKNLPTIIIEIVKAVPQIITGIVQAFGNLMYQIVEIGGNIVKGLWQGIQQLASWLWDKVTGWISGIWDGIMSFFGIHSPSRKMAWIGEMLVEGLAGSIDANGDEAIRAAEELSADVNSAMADIGKGITARVPTDFTVMSGSDMVGIANPGGTLFGNRAVAASSSSTYSIENSFSIGELVVREEADINRIARQLYELEQRAMRKKGLVMV